MELTEQQKAALLRWRLVLGKGAEGACGGTLNLGALCAGEGQGEEGEGQTEGGTGQGKSGKVIPGSRGQGIQDRQGNPLSSQLLVGIDGRSGIDPHADLEFGQ